MLQFTAQQIAMMIQGHLEGDANVTINNFGKIEEAKKGDISFLANPKYEEFLYTTQASIVIIKDTLVLKKSVSATLIKVPDAYAAFATLLTKYQALKAQELQGVEQPSFIAPSAKTGKNLYLAAFAHIGNNVHIGDDVKIYPNVVIAENVSIGNNVVLHPGVIIYADCIIGNNVTIHANAVIGSDGFGFAPKTDGSYQKVPQLGNVVIEDNVEIGSNTTIDRATIGSTYIRKGVKLDNLIQIAHNVDIGEDTVIAAQSGISGSTKIGKSVMMGGQAGASGHLTVADGVKVAARSGLTKSIKEANLVVAGYPAGEHSATLRSQIQVKNLPLMEKRLKELEILVQQLAQKG